MRSWDNGEKVTATYLPPIRYALHSAVMSFVDWDGHFLKDSDYKSRTISREAFNLPSDIQEPEWGGRKGQRIVLEKAYPGNIDTVIAIQGILLASHYGNWKFTYDDVKSHHYFRHSVGLLTALSKKVLAILSNESGLNDRSTIRAGLEPLFIAACANGANPEDATEFVDSVFASFESGSFSNLTSPKWKKIAETLDRYGSPIQTAVKTSLNCAKRSGPTVLLESAILLQCLEEWKKSGGSELTAIPPRLLGDWDTSLNKMRAPLDQFLDAALTDEFTTLRETVGKIEQAQAGCTINELKPVIEKFISEAETSGTWRCKAPGQLVQPNHLIHLLESLVDCDFESRPRFR